MIIWRYLCIGACMCYKMGVEIYINIYAYTYVPMYTYITPSYHQLICTEITRVIAGERQIKGVRGRERGRDKIITPAGNAVTSDECDEQWGRRSVVTGVVESIAKSVLKSVDRSVLESIVKGGEAE